MNGIATPSPIAEELRRKNASLEMLFGIATAANEAASVETALEQVLDRVCRFMGWPVGHAYLAGEDPTELVSSPVWHLEEPERLAAFREASDPIRFDAGEGLPGRVLARGEPAWVEDVSQDPRFYRAPVAAELGIRAGFAFPVLISRQVVAVLEFYGREASPPDAEILELMTHVGTILGRVIERQRTQEELKRRSEQLAEAQQLAHLGSWQWDIEADRITWSDELYRIYGLEPESFEANFEAFLGRLHPDDRAHAEQVVDRAYREGTPFDFVHRVVTPAGELRHVHGRGEVILNDKGRPVRMVGTGQDVTERVESEKRQRQLLREQLARERAEAERERLHRTLLQAPAVIAILNGPEHVFELANEQFLSLIEHRPVAGRRARDVLPEIEGQGFFELLDRVYETGEPYVGREERILWDRYGTGELEEGFFNFVYQPLTDDEGRVYGILSHAVEVTDQVLARREVERKAEELARTSAQLERSNRELDQFAYVASHDLKAPLRGIANLSQWLEEDLGEDLTPKAREHLQLLHSRAHRMESLIDGLLAYSRIGRRPATAERVDTAELVRGVVELLAVPPEVSIDIEARLPTLTTERLPLEQVFHNLIGNAVKFCRVPEPRIEISARPVPGGWELAVSDNGPGIAPRFQKKIWQMFQTLQARDEVEGSGLGLALVKKIVETRGGWVRVESEEGKGATFRFLWPDGPGQGTGEETP